MNFLSNFHAFSSHIKFKRYSDLSLNKEQRMNFDNARLNMVESQLKPNFLTDKN